MAFDACMMRAVLSEYKREFPEAKIEKVLQPQSDEVDFLLHYGRSSRRLVFNVGPNSPRLQISDIQKENPLKAPMFCMLLRKYFQGAKIVGVEQPGFDRIAEFSVSAYDDMGFPTTRYVVCEIMGKYANLIVLDSEKKILAALKIIDFAASTVRQVLPGLKYQVPAKPEKLSPLVIDKAIFFEKLAMFTPSRTAEKFITETYSGIATQIAHEIVFRATSSIDVPVGELDFDKFYEAFLAWQNLLAEEHYTPTVIFGADGKPQDYSYMDITYLGNGFKKETYPDFASLFDKYFAERDRIERVRQRSKDVITLINTVEARTKRKLAIQRESLLESENGERYKRYADLITANIYCMKKGDAELTCVDYYDDGCPEVKIPLDTRMSPSQNAQKLYKLYNKCKNAKAVLTEQIVIWEAELRYLESVRVFLLAATTEADIAEIREELYRFGYASKMRGYKPAKPQKLQPHEFKTTSGLTVLVGRNNTQNDTLTFKVAKRDDIWFHVKDAPGSHVILVTEGEEPDARDYTEAAELAAAYSSLSDSPTVAVDYTEVRYVKKPSGAKPGFVIYKTNYTAFVTPKKLEK